MRDPEFPVRFQPSGREVFVLPGTRLIEAAAEAGVIVETPCGGEGLCGRCRIVVTSGAVEPTATERHWLSSEELREGWRLACQSVIAGPTVVTIPPTSQPATEHKILVHAGTQAATTDDPPVRKRYVELPPPCRGDDAPDMLRLEQSLNTGRLSADLSLMAELPSKLRAAEFRGTAVLINNRLIDFEPGNTAADSLAVAVDIGTTTIVAVLVDVITGSERAVASRLNPQTQFGDDVLSRILYTRNNSDGLRQLSDSIRTAVDEMIGELCERARVDRRQVYDVTFSGNTTMQQLLCNVDTRWLGELPFAAAMAGCVTLPAADLGIHIHPRGSAYVMPVIGGFVGGDTVAGILATRIADATEPTLLVDIGTNGEIVLQAGGSLFAASTAAGPAFEGARISCGVRGCTGAIEKVVVDGHLRINVIGNVAPSGLCGSGLIDAAAEMLRHGLLTPQGRLLKPEELAPSTLPDLAKRVVRDDGGTVAFLLASAAESADGRPITLTQRDLRELQLATGAIRAGIRILLRRAGLQPKDLHRVLIGGGFGNFIRRSNAQRIGLLPTEVERGRIRYMGNTSLAGARLAALSQDARESADELARRTKHVDLSTDPEFLTEFADAMVFPEQ